MNQIISWIKEQPNERKFKQLMMGMIIIDLGLLAEFILFEYNVLKIVRYLCLLIGLFIIAWIDKNEKRIPNKILVILLGIRMILIVCEWIAFPEWGLSVLFSSGIGMLLGGGLFIVAYFISRGGIGFGDVKLFAVIGAYVGSGSIMIVTFFSVITSSIYSIVMLILKKIKLKEEIPFAPFVLVGTILTMVLGM